MQNYTGLDPAIRLIVAADFKPTGTGIRGVRREVIKLAQELQDIGVILKLNSILRACGYTLIEQIHQLGLKVMVDLKLNDIPQTMEIDALLIEEYRPEFLTVMCAAHIDGMRRVQAALPETEVMGVTVLTSLKEEKNEPKDIFGRSAGQAVIDLTALAHQAGLESVVCSPQEARLIRDTFGTSFIAVNNPGIRPAWAEVENDDQARQATIGEAISDGAKRIILGRPILNVKNRRKAVMHCIEEIQNAMTTSV